MCKISFKEWMEAIQEVYGKVFPKTLLQILKAKIEYYDTSENVNSFIINGESFWLDKNTRVGLMHLANCSEGNIELMLKDKILTIPVDVAKSLLSQLEVYAGKCYLQTQKHLMAILEMKKILILFVGNYIWQY